MRWVSWSSPRRRLYWHGVGIGASVVVVAVVSVSRDVDVEQCAASKEQRYHDLSLAASVRSRPVAVGAQVRLRSMGRYRRSFSAGIAAEVSDDGRSGIESKSIAALLDDDMLQLAPSTRVSSSGVMYEHSCGQTVFSSTIPPSFVV